MWSHFSLILKNHSKDCPYLETQCTNPGCQDLVTKHNIEQHLSNYCNYRLTPCDHCKELFPLAEQEVSEIVSCTIEICFFNVKLYKSEEDSRCD